LERGSGGEEIAWKTGRGVRRIITAIKNPAIHRV